MHSPLYCDILIFFHDYSLFLDYCRSYHLNPMTKVVYPVTLNKCDKLHLINQDIVQSGVYKNHFFDYKDMHIKYQICKDDVSQDCTPLRCVCGTRRWHITDESTVDPVKQTRIGPRKSYKKHLQEQKHEFLDWQYKKQFQISKS